MKLSSRASLACLVLSQTLLVGCGTLDAAGKDRAASSKAIWPPVSVPHVLPSVTITNGEAQTLDIDGCVSGKIARVTLAGINGADALIVSVKEGTVLEISAAPNANQQGVVNLTVETEDGKSHAVGFPVTIKSRPAKRISFKAPKGTAYKTVSIAGKFNGWNAAANPLRDDDHDGVWQADVPIEPGTWPYKYVVDGNWILDPNNRDTLTDGGNKNSKLVVEGAQSKAPSTLGISMLPGNAPGVGRQGGFKVLLNAGAILDEAGVQVFVNNTPLAPGEYGVNPVTGVVSLSVPPTRWGVQQFVSLTAKDSTGRTGSYVAPFDFADSPRSPKDETIYYVVLDRFMNGDSANDDPVSDPEVHPLNNYMGGDIAGVREMIAKGYFNDLGVTTLWISPPYEQPDIAYKDSKPPFRKLTGYHGYWPTDMRKVEPRWGTIDEFRAMVDEAHAKGLAVIIDFVSNHLHEENAMVKLHPDWFSKLHLPDGSPNIRLYDEHPFSTWFDDFLPDIAYDQSMEATEYMTDTEVWWLEQTGADGFRHDAVKHVPNVFWEMSTRKLNDQIAKPEHRRLYQVGETVSSRTTINQFIGPKLLDGQFDFPLFWTIEEAFAWESIDMVAAAKSLQDTVDIYPPDAIMSPFLGNHDVPRFMGKAEFDNAPGKKGESEEKSFTDPAHIDDLKSYDKLKLAFSFLLTIPGAPMLYYGDEIGMTGSGRPDARRLFIPEAEWDTHNKATYADVKEFLHARKESIALRRGAYQLLSSNKEQLVYARIAPEEVVVVALQRRAPANGKLTIALPTAWGKPSALEPLALDGLEATDAGLTLDGSMQVSSKPYSAGVWRVR